MGVFQNPDSIIYRKRGMPFNRKPLLCGVCGAEMDGTDADIKRIALARHVRTVHQIPRCSPEFWQ